MDPLSVVGWGLVYVAVGSMVGKVVYYYLHTPATNKVEDMIVAFWAMIVWPLVLLVAPFGVLLRALVASWEWWLED
jgi:hypothetical protein